MGAMNYPINLIQRAGSTSGVLTLSNGPQIPVEQIQRLLDAVCADMSIQTRINDAYEKTGAEKLVWKDSFANGKGGDTVDQKRVLDLAAHRIAAIAATAPEVAAELGAPLTDSLTFFRQVEVDVVPMLLQALSLATKNSDIGSNYQTAYRMVDYYERRGDSAAPRCGEHRDYGTLTIIFQDGAGGLEAKVAGEWQPLPPASTVLIFGWCSQVRSNARIQAALHRVVDSAHVGATVPRRTAAVLFVAPDADASVAPVVLPGEEVKYRNLKRAGDLKGIMARKWEMREGTLADHKVAAELEEQRLYKTQDAIVEHMVGM